MKLIKNRQIVADSWQTIADESNIKQLPGGKLIVSLAFWNDHKQALIARDDDLGIMLNPEDDVADIAADLASFALVALQFPAFRDGRAYSQARNLRQHHGYQGEIRARGNVLRDQLAFMERVGFNSFEIDSHQDINDAINGFDEIDIKYQSSSDEPLPLYKRATA